MDVNIGMDFGFLTPALALPALAGTPMNFNIGFKSVDIETDTVIASELSFALSFTEPSVIGGSVIPIPYIGQDLPEGVNPPADPVPYFAMWMQGLLSMEAITMSAAMPLQFGFTSTAPYVEITPAAC